MFRCCFGDYDSVEHDFLYAFHPFGKGFYNLRERKREGATVVAVMASTYIPGLEITFKILPVPGVNLSKYRSYGPA